MFNRELFHPEGGFYSALDADSEGEEGKFYVWNYKEVKNLLGEDADIFCEYYDITEKGIGKEKIFFGVKEPLENLLPEKISRIPLRFIEKEQRKIIRQERK